MNITLAQLEIFSLTARHKNVSLAADACFISQAAASMRLSDLEAQLKQKLFDRDGKRLVLNSYGRQLLAQANAVIKSVTEFKMSAQSPDQVSGQLKIGASTTIANNLLPTILNKFLSTYPEIDVELMVYNTETCMKKLINYEIDIALVEGVYHHQNIEYKPWTHDNLQIICHPSHPLTKKRNLTLTDLSEYPWILRETSSGTRQVFESALQQSSFTMRNIMIVNSSVAIKNMLLGNKKSLSCLSSLIVANDIKGKKLSTLNVKNVSLKRHFYQLHRCDKSKSMIAKLFEDFTQAALIK